MSVTFSGCRETKETEDKSANFLIYEVRFDETKPQIAFASWIAARMWIVAVLLNIRRPTRDHRGVDDELAAIDIFVDET